MQTQGEQSGLYGSVRIISLTTGQHYKLYKRIKHK